MHIIDSVKITIKRYQLVYPGDRIVIGVSGGPDSLALVYILNSIKEELGLSLLVAHLNHKLRKEAKNDLLFVKKTARELNLPFVSDEINVAKLRKKGSLEEIAREARFRFLFKVANKFKTDKIALGHTRDDQAETVLMWILRGTGLYGLRGILPERKINGFTIIRPLIEIYREEINKFLRLIKLKPRLDSSNLENIFFRNKVRNKLMPLLQKDYNPNIKEILSCMAENVGLDYEYLYNVSLSLFNEVVVKNNSWQSKIRLAKFSKFHPAVQRMIFRIAINEIGKSIRRLNFRHWKELEDLILRRPTGSIVDLPHQIKVQKNKGQIVISLRNS
jgi:tRNA(Ile)-lysidine synthase